MSPVIYVAEIINLAIDIITAIHINVVASIQRNVCAPCLNIFQKALDFRQSRTVKVDTWEDFKTQIENSMFVYAHWDGTPETEQKIKEETKATIRCIPLDDDYEDGKCIYSGQPSKRRVIFARAY